MKTKFLTIALISTLLLCAQAKASGGDKAGNGGNSTAQWAKSTLVNRFDKLSEAYGDSIILKETQIPLNRIVFLLKTTQIRVVTGPLLNEGQPVEAKNYPDQNLIEIDEERFEKAYKETLLFHEVLGLVSLEDSDYSLSTDLERESELISGPLSNFPLGSEYVDAHRTWAQSSFTSVDEAEKMIRGKRFQCSWISWASITTRMRLDPNQWWTRSDVQPEARVSAANPIKRGISIGMNSHFNRGSGGPSQLENGKVVTTFTFDDGGTVKVFSGKIGNKIFLKVRDTSFYSMTDFEAINVCE